MRLWKRLAALGVLVATPELARATAVELKARDFVVIRRDSGPENYYSVLTEGAQTFIRGEYRPPLKTVVLGHKIPEQFRKEPRKLSWRWRVRELPANGNECDKKRDDSAAVVYLIFKHGLHWYTLKYAWSTSAPKGAVCASKRSPVVGQDTVVLESGGPLDTWVSEEIDPTAEFRKQFRDGDPKGHVPDLVGIGVMTEGDQTKTPSSADFADFVLTPRDG